MEEFEGRSIVNQFLIDRLLLFGITLISITGLVVGAVGLGRFPLQGPRGFDGRDGLNGTNGLNGLNGTNGASGNGTFSGNCSCTNGLNGLNGR